MCKGWLQGCSAPGHQRETTFSSQVQSSLTYYTWAEGFISTEKETHIAVSLTHLDSAETAGNLGNPIQGHSFQQSSPRLMQHL
ncbi:hypothetical protein MHYP_G00272690 [Metynnis hypsauchen]